MSTFSGLIQFINEHEKFIISAHEMPDGDAVGSEYALAKALKKLGKTVKIINSDPPHQKFLFIDEENLLNDLDDPDVIPEDIREYALILVDTNDLFNIGLTSTKILPRIRGLFILDHHEPKKDPPAESLIETSASSTGELVYELLIELGVEIDLDMAQAMFMGIVFDTGSFIYPRTTAKTFKIAHELVKIGVSPNHVYANVYESNSVSSLILQSKVLSSLELHFDNQVAIQHMTKDLIALAGATYEEADYFVNIPLKSGNIKASIFFKENEEGDLRCSLRSKGSVNVAQIAQTLGGGGHKNAAGFRCSESFEVTKKEVLDKLSSFFR